MGGYLSKPRWTWKSRRTRIEVRFTKIIDADEITTLKLGEIERRIHDALIFDDYEWQKKPWLPFIRRTAPNILSLLSGHALRVKK